LGDIIPGLARLVDGRWRIVLTGQRFTESDETLKALEGVKRTGSKYTFVSARGTRFNARGQWKPREKLRTAANVPDVQLDDIRDDSYSAACSAPGVDERFARLLAGAVKAADPTRPLVENDWIEPDPGRVFTTPIVTAHWYGTLHAGFLTELDSRCRAGADLGRPLLVSEFGDWGLPLVSPRTDAPFWWYGDALSAAIGRLPWPAHARCWKS